MILNLLLYDLRILVDQLPPSWLHSNIPPFLFLGGLLTPVQTPTTLTSASSISTDQQRPNKLQIRPPPLENTLTPETSPLGVLSPAATNAAVNLVMNSVKRPFGIGHLPGISEEEPMVKRYRENTENGIVKDEINGQQKDANTS